MFSVYVVEGYGGEAAGWDDVEGQDSLLCLIFFSKGHEDKTLKDMRLLLRGVTVMLVVG